MLCFRFFEIFASSAPGSTLFGLEMSRLLLYPAVRASASGHALRIALVGIFLKLTDAFVALATDAEIDTFALAGLVFLAAIDAFEPLVAAATLTIGPHEIGIAISKRAVGRHADDVA